MAGTETTLEGTFSDFDNSLNFLKEIVEDMEEVFNTAMFRNKFVIAYGEETHELFKLAFEQSKQRMLKRLEEYQRDYNQSLENDEEFSQSTKMLYAGLEEVGLIGVELEMKKRVKKKSWNIFKLRKTGILLLKALGVMNKILGSFSSVIPAAHAVKEIKDMGETAVEVSDIYDIATN